MRNLTFAAIVIAATQLGATDCGEIIEDPGFDHWCGDRLCYWDIERGDIRRVATWHAGDDGAEFVGDDVAISQMTEVTSTDTDCIRFEMIADVEETAEVHLEVDVRGDGTIEWRERIPTAYFEKVSLRIGLAGPYEGVRFRLTKVGSGRAVLAHIGAEVADDGCPSYVDVGVEPLGTFCYEEDVWCESNLCTGFVCSECEDGSCADGELCGRAATGALYYSCVAAGSRAVGEPCFADGECTNGLCNDELCTECEGAGDCGGAACVGVPGIHLARCDVTGRASGAPCVLDGDCASGACAGTPVGTCDGHPCYDDSLCESQTCTFLAVAGGTCQ